MGSNLSGKVNRRKPVVFHFITGLDIGGTEMMLLRLLPTLTDDFEHVVCSLKTPGQVGERLQQVGIQVQTLKWINFSDIGVIWRLYRLLRQLRPDTMVNYLIHADLLGRIVGRVAGVTNIISSQRGSLLQWEWLRVVDRLSSSLVTRYVVQSFHARSEIARRLGLPEKRIYVIANGVDAVLLPSRASARSQLGLAPAGYYIACISQLRRNKGHDILLNAFARLQQQRPDTQLLLAGDGELRSFLEEEINRLKLTDKVHILGERSDIRPVLAAADLFVLPTLAEGMSNALMEAMAAGLPCVASDIEANKVLITDQQNGRLFASGQVDSLHRVLTEVLADMPDAYALGERARQTIISQFSLAQATAHWRELLINLLHPTSHNEDKVLVNIEAGDAPGVPQRAPAGTPKRSAGGAGAAGPASRDYSPNSAQPLVSILISCRNSASTLDRCLQSVKDQTYASWQLICVDDGSQDTTRSVLDKWREVLGSERIRIIHHPESIGLTPSLNEAWRDARGELLARLDADDWWLPEKLMQQVAYFQAHPHCGLLGTWYVNVGASLKHTIKLPTTHQAISRTIFHANPFGHSCVIMRADLMKAVGGYDTSVRFGQDWDLWLRLWPKTQLANLPLPLCKREVGKGLSTTHARQQSFQALKTAHRYIQDYRQPWWHYLYLGVFIGSLVAPGWVKKMYARTTAN